MRLLTTLTALLAIHSVSLSATIYVPDNYATIQGAIDASSNDDVVIVRPGTYVENIDFVGKAIHLRSEQGEAVTTIDGNQADCVVLFNNNEGLDSILEGFTITNGIGYLGGGICCITSSPKIIDNTICNNVANDGGAIHCYQSASPEIISNEIRQNAADVYGGIHCDRDCQPLIVQNIIENNHATTGAAIAIHWCPQVIIADNIIRNNSANAHAGISFSYSEGEIRNNRIENNFSVVNYTGQISVSFNCMVIISDNDIISDNYQNNTSGIYLRGSAIVSNNLIRGHSATKGGGIKCQSDAIIESNYIIDNKATAWGGGIFIQDCKPTIRNNIILRNSAELGGGICIRLWTTPYLTNNVIVSNCATGFGGGIYIYYDDYGRPKTLRMGNAIMWDNEAPLGPEISLDGHNLFFSVTYSDVEGGQSSCFIDPGCILEWGDGNIDADPLFVDVANDDLHLTWKSPCLNAGADILLPLGMLDNEGDPRVEYGLVDMGADEFHSHLYHAGEVVPGGTVDLRFVGLPLSPVVLAWGQTILESPFPTQHGNLYIWPLNWYGNVGTIPTSGVLSMPVTIPSTWQSGDHAPLQALIGPWGGPWTQLTNAEVLVVE